MVGEYRLLQPLGMAKASRRVPLEPQGLELPAFAQGVQREKPRLGKRPRGLEQPRLPDRYLPVTASTS